MSSLASRLLFLCCVGCSPSPAVPLSAPPAVRTEPTAPPIPFDTQAFPRAAQAFREKNIPSIADGIPGATTLTVDEQRAYCGDLVARAKAHLDDVKVAHRPRGDCAIEIAVSDLTRLGLVAKSLDRTTKSVARYDLEFFFRKPFAAASYDREARVLYLPHDGLYDPDSLTLAHELRHVEMHEAELRGDVSLIEYQAILTGEAFRPDPLHLDEVYAYAGDILTLVGRLRRAGELDKSAVGKIHEAVRAARRPDPELLTVERNADFHRLALRLTTLRDHLAGALEPVTAIRSQKALSIIESTSRGIPWARIEVVTKGVGPAGKVEIAMPAFLSTDEFETALGTSETAPKPSREAVRRMLIERSFRVLERRVSSANALVVGTMLPTLAEFAKSLDPSLLDTLGDLASALQEPIPRSVTLLDSRF